jgi:hypothetical protein
MTTLAAINAFGFIALLLITAFVALGTGLAIGYLWRKTHHEK